MSITLRDATAEDNAFLREVYASSRADEFALAPWSQEQREAFLDSQFQAPSIPTTISSTPKPATKLSWLTAGEPAGFTSSGKRKTYRSWTSPSCHSIEGPESEPR